MSLGQGSSGCAVARVSGPPEPSATPSTYPVPVPGHTRIIRYPDGHAVISRDRYGTDITVQRAPGSFGRDGGVPEAEGSDGRHRYPDTRTTLGRPPAHPTEQSDPSFRDEYRRRMLERLDAQP